MTLIPVKVVHPAPVVYVPSGARRLVSWFARCETDVALRMAERDDLVPVGGEGERIAHVWRLRRGEDGFWLPLATRIEGGRQRLAKPEEFVRWLGDPTVHTSGGFEVDLAGTPLLAGWGQHYSPLGPASVHQGRSGTSRGDAEGRLDRVREVRFDGTDAARARLVRYLGTEILLTRFAVYKRVRPLVVHGVVNGHGPRDLYGFNVKTSQRLEGIRSLPVHPANAEYAARRWSMPLDLDPAAWEEVGRVLGEVPPHDGDLDVLANGLPGAALDLLWHGPGQACDRVLWEAARDRAEELRVAAVEGLVGGNGTPFADLSDREPLFLRVREAIEAVTRAYPRKEASRFLRMALAYLDDEALPRIRRGSREIEPSDADALGALAP